MSFWGRIKFSLKQAFSAGQRATDAEAVDGGPFQAHQKAQIIHLATEILDGRLGLIDGSSQLLLYMGGFPEAFPTSLSCSMNVSCRTSFPFWARSESRPIGFTRSPAARTAGIGVQK